MWPSEVFAERSKCTKKAPTRQEVVFAAVRRNRLVQSGTVMGATCCSVNHRRLIDSETSAGQWGPAVVGDLPGVCSQNRRPGRLDLPCRRLPVFNLGVQRVTEGDKSHCHTDQPDGVGPCWFVDDLAGLRRSSLVVRSERRRSIE